ncbi:DnaJ family domain-containing protein [Bacillus smithii]|uniref:DnaJ family domain-containing protein n=1 Tax=Bacillus smithii TaxID=1479 RepID=UPI003D20775C
MDYFTLLAEEKIKAAYEKGEFDDLPGKGKPMKMDSMVEIPEDLRMAYRIMKNAGYMVEEKEIRKEFLTIEELIRQCHDEQERKRLEKQWSQRLIQYNQLLSKRKVKTNSSLFKRYEQKIEKRIIGSNGNS